MSVTSSAIVVTDDNGLGVAPHELESDRSRPLRRLVGAAHPRDAARPQPAPTSAKLPHLVRLRRRTEQIRYSRLDQINRDNVKQLQQAWTYDSGETGGLQTQPIVVDGVLYGITPTHKTFALRAATGEHLWTFDSGIKAQGPNRGVMYWTEAAAIAASLPRSRATSTRSTRAPASRSRRSATTAASICARDLGRDPRRSPSC